MPAPAPPVAGALAIEPSHADHAVENDPSFAPPLVELVVSEERRHRPRWLGIFLAVAIIASGAGGWVVFGPGGASAEAAVYKRFYQMGESHTYTLAMTMRGAVELRTMRQPLNIAMNIDVTEKVLSVAPDGTSTVRFTLDLAALEANGRNAALPENISVTARIARDGRVLSVEGAEGLQAGGANPMGGFFGPESMQPAFPSGKIKPGDTWTNKISQKFPFGDKPITFTVRNKLLRLETEHGIPVAVMHSVMEVPLNLEFGAGDLEKMAGLSGGGPVPEGAKMSFRGSLTFDAIQTVVRATGRPIAVTGNGVFDVEVKASGIGAPAKSIKMRFDMEADFAEILPAGAA